MVLEYILGGDKMGKPKSYTTKQGKAVLSYISSVGSRQVAAEEISDYFAQIGQSIAYATIYRHLERLEQLGVVRKLVMNGEDRAYFQYVGDSRSDSFYLKCERCGNLLCLDCGEAENFGQHILQTHAFQVDPVKTIFYGKCKDCLTK
jgi:Fur family ferric uptake transcriptional regulator